MIILYLDDILGGGGGAVFDRLISDMIDRAML